MIQVLGAVLIACIRPTADLKVGAEGMGNLIRGAKQTIYPSCQGASVPCRSLASKSSRFRTHLIFSAAVLMLLGPLLVHAGVIHVDSSASGGGDGSSWSTAHADLQLALSAAAPGDEIWVAAGVYKPTSGADRTATFQLKNNVSIYGGFAGAELTRDERDFNLNITVLSGDIDSNDATDGDGVVNSAADSTGENSKTVVTGSNTDASALLDGFTITAGLTDGVGAGMLNSSGSPTLINVTFSGNSAAVRGGGMYNVGGSPILSRVTFRANSAQEGGCIGNLNSSSPMLSNVKFIGNSSVGLGGGMYNRGGSSPTLTEVTFRDNSAGSWGGGMFNFESSPILSMVTFVENSAVDSGGGMANWASVPTVANTEFIANSVVDSGGGMFNANNSSPILTNIIFLGNSADFGGGMLNNSSSPVLTNVAFSGNSSTNDGGAMRNTSSSNPDIRNVIFWNNKAGSSIGTSLSSIYNESGVPIISHSLVQGCKAEGIWNSACGSEVDNTNLPDADPFFVANPDPSTAPTTGGDLHLRAGSSAIDAGNDGFFPDIENATDLDGNSRKTGLAIDLGAFENNVYEVVLTALGSGSVDSSPEPDPVTGGYALGVTVEVTAAASPGWSFANWSGDLNGSANPETFIIAGNMEAIASFAKNPPVADAGAGQTLIVESLVTLDGSGSFDEDPDQTLSYQWSQGEGPTVTLSDPTAVHPTFTAPLQPEQLSFELLVTNDLDIQSAPDSVIISVVDVTIEGLSTNNDGPTVLGQPTAFSASITSGSNVIYDWSFGDGNLALDAGATPSHIYAQAGEFTVNVTARNAKNQLTASTLVDVTNQPPVADAGTDQIVDAGDLVTLNGSGSFDQDDHVPLGYQWSQTEGEIVTLSNSTSETPTFDAPFDAEPIVFELVVSDSFGLSSAVDSVTVRSSLPEFEVFASTGSGNGSITPASQTVIWGEAASFTVIPDEGWSLNSVSGDACKAVNTSGTEWKAENITEKCLVVADFLVNSYNIGGSISGLEGDGLALLLNNAEILEITESGTFQFMTELNHDTNYRITIETSPSNPTQACFIADGTGTVNAANVDDVIVSCEAGFTIGGAVSGLKLPGLVLDLNSTSALYFEQSGDFIFLHPLADGTNWRIVLIAPRDHQCELDPNSGTVAGVDVVDVAVDCTTDIEFADGYEILLDTPMPLD